MDDQATTQNPAEGATAPDFELVDDSGTARRLSDRRGSWTVIYFYPKDDTPGCTTQACEFRDVNADIVERDAEVWGVSVLNSASKAAFKKKFDLTFVLLADENHEVAERYGVWVEKQNYGRSYMGIQRATFLVDPDGRVAKSWPKVKPEGHASQVLAALDESRSKAAVKQTR